jgi:hypothetical protein
MLQIKPGKANLMQQILQTAAFSFVQIALPVK